MYIIDKKHSLLNSIKKDNYIDEFEDVDSCCNKCVYFGKLEDSQYWLCAKNYPEFDEVCFCGHCDDFSNNKKINLFTYLSLRMAGYEFYNKVR